MIALLASLIFVAAGEVAPPPPPPVPDSEVARYLKSNELVEWNSAMRMTEQGQTRVKQGVSIMTVVRPATADKTAETPEQIKLRGKKIVDEGETQIQKALPSLVRLRLAAATRAAELVKPVDFKAEFAQKTWDASVSQAVLRLQKQARDAGYAQTHVIGGIALLGDGKLGRPASLADDLRAAWNKLDERSLAPIPAGGYAYTLAAGQSAPALAKSLKAATAPKQTAVVWAEFYALSSEGSIGLLFVRLADAHSMRIIGSDVALTEFHSKAPVSVALDCALSLRDDRSFIPRLEQSGEWVLGFSRDSNPLGSALLAHLCVEQTKIGIAAAPYVVIVAGGGPAGAEGIKARWRSVQAETDGTYLAYGVSSVPEGAAAIDVGQLTLKVSAPAPAKK
jgi:hypothetical protein